MPTGSPSTHLAAFLRSHRQPILAAWHAAVRDRPAARGLSVESLLDHIPDLLDAIADTSEEHMEDPRARLSTDSAERHALERLTEGLDLAQVVVELAVLRDCILAVWDRERAPGAARPEVRFLNRSVDRAITASVERYIAARDRTLRALDRISTAALESRDLDDLLQRLLHVLVDTTPSVETGVILLRDGDELVVRAAVGAEEDVRAALRIPIGEGFSGRIAAERRPLLITEREMSQVRSPRLRARNLKSLYGVPLTQEGVVVGVAHIGSVTAPDFSDQDKRLLQAMADRAASGIVQHQLREGLERRAAELAAIIESMPDPVLVGDARGVRVANRAALSMLGVSSVEEVNRHGPEIANAFAIRRARDGASLPAAERPFWRALAGERVVDEVVVRNARTAGDRVFRMAAAPVLTGDRVVGGVVIASDVTERRQQELEHQRLYVQAQQAVADREHALAVVSHDLRNPLNTIRMSAEVLADHDPEPALARKVGATIRRAVDRMNRMISDLMDFSSIQNGRFSLTLQPIDVAAVVEEAAEGARPEARARGLELRAQAAHLLVRADRDRLVQALGNLVGNAVKATSQGHVTVRAEARNGEVLFAVSDSGPGIPEDVQRHLFEPYWRGRNAGYKGSGLGLAITCGIVEAHGGRIWAESRQGKGASFFFTIPMGAPVAGGPRPL
jgi:signal transduction histidine kinase/putative methionine-R-sulfoxide reductase with GAF domain